MYFRLLLVIALLPTAALPAQVHTIAEQYLFQSVNAERAAAGMPALVWNDPLTIAARLHAERMRSQREVAHQFRGEPDLIRRAAATGARFSRVTENVATSDSIVTMHSALMHSPHHRENILDPKVTSMGVAVVATRGEMWAVEDFSRDVASLSFDRQEATVMKQVTKTGLLQISASEDARATCRMQTGYAGARPWFVMRYTTGDLNRLPEQLLSKIGSGRVHRVVIGACDTGENDGFSSYSLAVLLFR